MAERSTVTVVQRLRRQGETALTRSRLVVLTAILRLAADHGCASEREILALTGYRSPNLLHNHCFPDLEAAGLIARRPGKGRTIRPLYRLELLPAAFAGKESRRG